MEKAPSPAGESAQPSLPPDSVQISSHLSFDSVAFWLVQSKRSRPRARVLAVAVVGAGSSPRSPLRIRASKPPFIPCPGLLVPGMSLKAGVETCYVPVKGVNKNEKDCPFPEVSICYFNCVQTSNSNQVIPFD
ncbi:hypothetical protein PIB30_062815 [Stylosanthes scabra]|uniref:Uncharacterized protein n=1 Tax=Stylosanthes scabra TaxID=79078 RepID=A0ABU6ZJZ0_9FABA|nr:hypothetical protein [Stylosanthes scabra]